MVKLPIIYLGIPLGANPRRIETWKLVMEKIEKRLALWKAKLLSRARRLVLIKPVLTSLPLYYQSIFKIPKGVATQIIKLQRHFFWFADARRQEIPLISWDIVQRPKALGGLGVGNITVQNAALLFKWWWHFSEGSHPLWKRVVCSNNALPFNASLTDFRTNDHTSS